MMFAQVLQDTDRSGTWHIRIAVAVLGTVLAISDISLRHALIGGFGLSLVPAIVMSITLLSGCALAALSATVIVASVVLLGQHAAWQAVTFAALAVLSGAALRRGAPALLVSLVLFLGALLSPPSLAFHLTSANPAQLANAAAHAGINVALATAVLLFMPRRSEHFAPRCRTRWDHVIFTLVLGTVSVTILWLFLVPMHSTEMLAVRLSTLLLLAFAGSWVLTKWCERTTRRLQATRDGPDLKGSALPGELVGLFVGLTRETNHLRRDAERHDRKLLQARRAAVHMHQKLQRITAAFSQRSAELTQAISARDTASARYDALMEFSSAAEIFADRNGIIQAVSQSTAHLMGYRAGALEGKPLNTLIPADWITEHPLDLAMRQRDGRSSWESNAQVRTANGRNEELSIQVYSFQSRGELMYLARLRDPDETQKTLPALNEKALAQPMRDPRDLFIATVSHELRTPLHGLIATLDMLRAGDPSTDAYRRQLSIARGSARALLKIANDVLDLTRSESEAFPLERQRFGLGGLLREIVDEARARAVSYGLDVSMQVQGELPASFIGDPARLKQILANLVSNALKFTAAGSVTLTVRYDGRVCTVDVQDTGEGIPADEQQRIFDPFVQLESRAGRNVGGTGLGLPISRRLAEAMGGQLTLHRSGPRGSTFRLTLPLESSEELPPEDQSQRVFFNPGGRILVVEDNPANRYVAEALLTGLGCKATLVASGEQALELLRQREFDLILMDCQMPGMDGYETTREARRLLRRRVPIIAMTANAMADDRQCCIEAGMDDFLPKPFGRQALNAVLCKWLAAGAHRNSSETPHAASFTTSSPQVVPLRASTAKVARLPGR